MEIKDYLRAIRRWLWLPVVLPLVAGAGAGLLLLKQPLQYQATGSLVVPAVSSRGFSTSAALQYVATFKDVLISQPVVQQVSHKTGVPTKDLISGLSADTVTASSNIINVVYTGYAKGSVTTVVREATVDALNVIAQPQLVQAQNALSSGHTQLSNADSAISQYTADTGTLFPDQDFKTKQSELSQLLLELQQANLANDAQRAAALQLIIAERQKELTTLAAEVARYTALNEDRTAALTVVSHDEQLLGDAQALLAANLNSNTVTVTDLGKVSRVANVLKFTAIAAAVALILALALILLLELTHAFRPAETGPQNETAEKRRSTPPAAAPDLTPRPGTALDHGPAGDHLGELGPLHDGANGAPSPVTVGKNNGVATPAGADGANGAPPPVSVGKNNGVSAPASVETKPSWK
jgi:hypothetical protein